MYIFSATEGNKKCKQVRDCILSETKFSHLEMFQLLLNSAQFELKVKDMFKAVEYIIILFPHVISTPQEYTKLIVLLLNIVVVREANQVGRLQTRFR